MVGWFFTIIVVVTLFIILGLIFKLIKFTLKIASLVLLVIVLLLIATLFSPILPLSTTKVYVFEEEMSAFLFEKGEITQIEVTKNITFNDTIEDKSVSTILFLRSCDASCLNDLQSSPIKQHLLRNSGELRVVQKDFWIWIKGII